MDDYMYIYTYRERDIQIWRWYTTALGVFIDYIQSLFMPYLLFKPRNQDWFNSTVFQAELNCLCDLNGNAVWEQTVRQTDWQTDTYVLSKQTKKQRITNQLKSSINVFRKER